MKKLVQMIGREIDVNGFAREIYAFTQRFGAPVVGALLVTCADESERECVDAFQQNFADYALPSLKFGERSVFRIANLGARYEDNAVHIAEEHYSAAVSPNGFKLMVIKFNSHVSAQKDHDGFHYGQMSRYGRESTYCGALHALLTGASLPFANELREVFAEDGKNHLEVLLDEERIQKKQRTFLAAVINCSLQAKRVVKDIQKRQPDTPTVFVVISSVTLNKKTNDTEIPCGIHQIDWRGETQLPTFEGLAGDPEAIKIFSEGGLIRLHRQP
jgi:hypothetical protein